MLISKIGEFGLIERYRKMIKTDDSVIVGSGDDCAVLKYDRDHYQLFTCDMLVEGVDFTKNTDPALVGRKALAVSVSDICACGGIPKHAVVSLGLPRNFTLSKTDALTKGMFKLARSFKVNMVGGDLSRSDKLVLDVSMLGIVEKKNLVLRNGAKHGDIIFVSGALGGSIKGKHLRFTPRLKEARLLAKEFRINSMIDISDGLIQDLSHILKASKKGALLYEALIPVSKEAKDMEEALYAGEDFELLFTAARKQAKSIVAGYGALFHPIGEIVHKKYGLRSIGNNGKEMVIKAKGFQHF